ncbi:NlpC/P60 family protein [Nakamurella silvestris]|nr:NlpC/P60 family protein [Nakamurella silvestris]
MAQYIRTGVARRSTRRFAIATTAALALIVGGVFSASADPADPTDTSSSTSASAPAEPSTAAEAQKLWMEAQRKAEILNEKVLQAEEDVKTSRTAVKKAAAKVTAAGDAVEAAELKVADSVATVEGFRERLSNFANASFRGARLSQLSALLTAESAEDFLDDATALDQVAADTNAMMAEADNARTAAAAAQTEMEAKQADAETAKAEALESQKAAVKVEADLQSRKDELDAQVVVYRNLFDKLTEEERLAAIKAEEERLAREAEAERAAAAQAAQDAQAARDAQAAADAPAVSTQEQVQPLAAVADAPDAPAAETSSSVEEAPATSAAEEPEAPSGNSAAAAAVSAALSKVGASYVYGAAGPDAFDCSGLTSWAWAQAGVSIPRTSGGQAGLPSVPLDQLQPGDLVTYYSPVSHVAMYIGNGQVVHASTEGVPVYVTDLYGAGPSPSGHRPY